MTISQGPAGQTLIHIQDDAAAAAFFGEIAHETTIAVDTEAASFHRYIDRTYLLQVSSRNHTAVIDPLTVTGLGPLGRMMADPKIEMIFHDADYDLRMLDRDYGFRVTGVFDTRIAAQLLNEPGIGLAALLGKYLGVNLDKKYQRADWSRRPLSEEMLQYAAMDTAHLPTLRDILHDRLEAAGRLSWAREEFAALENIRWTMAEDEGFWRIKGSRLLRGQGIAILRELYEWRESLARQQDRAPFRILNNETLVELAKTQPRDLAALAAMKGVGGDTVRRRGGELLGAIERGLRVPPSEIPRLERGPKIRPDPAYLERVERLKAARNTAARRLDLAPGVLCPNGTLEAVARAEPRTVNDLAALPELRRWQIEALGEDLLRASEPDVTEPPA